MVSGWIEWKWTAEKPYPETLDTRVDIRTREGYESTHEPWSVGNWYGSGDPGASNWEDTGHPAEIVAYRIVG